MIISVNVYIQGNCSIIMKRHTVQTPRVITLDASEVPYCPGFLNSMTPHNCSIIQGNILDLSRVTWRFSRFIHFCDTHIYRIYKKIKLNGEYNYKYTLK